MGFGVIGAGRRYLHLQQHGSSCSGLTEFYLAFCCYLHQQFFNYKRVIDGGYRLRTKTQREDIKLITDKINQANDDIARGRQKLLRDELDHLDFKIIKKEKEELINDLENKLIKVSQITVTIKTDLDQAIDALSSIDKLYKDGDVRKKREIVGSIYPEKLIFDGTQYRTARLNEVVQLIYTLDNGFSKKRNGQTDQNFDLSTLVPRRGVEPLIPP